eukprot:821777-Prymnesium_polylepis.2
MAKEPGNGDSIDCAAPCERAGRHDHGHVRAKGEDSPSAKRGAICEVTPMERDKAALKEVHGSTIRERPEAVKIAADEVGGSAVEDLDSTASSQRDAITDVARHHREAGPATRESHELQSAKPAPRRKIGVGTSYPSVRAMAAPAPCVSKTLFVVLRLT